MLIRIGIYPHIAAGSSGHIPTFSIGRPVPGTRLQPATTSGRVCGVSAVVATKAVAAKQAITDLGNMAHPPSRRFGLENWAELRSCQPDATPASSSATPTGRRSPTSTSRTSAAGARRICSPATRPGASPPTSPSSRSCCGGRTIACRRPHAGAAVGRWWVLVASGPSAEKGAPARLWRGLYGGRITIMPNTPALSV
jgi:hypothetical protein